ncbi:20112_t:CDS:2 [Funneliformis geosporum]|uniref:14372_t:CDS:1 n=1 Tax=Funneliformis geosporum TaxID=1117311 RepID=A0A9W4SLM2_9GLOM|nr:20112_t:CDS:2 [Funneliformis geosporum]CAI2172903.1 14372_t:CDS:2 [Funneliformis geosporum]
MPLSHASRLAKDDSNDFYLKESDSDSEEFVNQRIQYLSEFKLYGPQGSFTVVAKGTSSLFNFFKPIKNSTEDEFVIDLTANTNDDDNALAGVKDNNNALDDDNAFANAKDNNNTSADIESNDLSADAKDNNNASAGTENNDSSAGAKDNNNMLANNLKIGFLNNWNIEINSLDFIEPSNYEINDKEIILEEESISDEIQDDDNHNFNRKLQKLEQILSSYNKKQNIYDYLRYQSIHAYFTY